VYIPEVFHHFDGVAGLIGPDDPEDWLSEGAGAAPGISV